MTYLCLIAYVAAIYVRPAEIFPTWAGVPVVEILSALTFAVAGFSYLATPRKFWDLPHDRFVVGVWAAIVASDLVSGWYGGAFRGFVYFSKIAFFYFLIRFAVRNQRHLAGFIAAICAANLFLALNGIVQFHTGTAFGGIPLNKGRVQGAGIFNDPNDLALTLLMVVPFLLSEATDAVRGLVSRAAALVMLVPIVVAILYTQSRGGVVGLAVILIASALQGRRKRGAVIVAGILGVAAAMVNASRLGMMDASEESAQLRIQAWKAALGMVKSHPLFGVGYDRFSEFHEHVAHNSFVHTLAELGLVGAFVWTGMCYWLFKALLPRRVQIGSTKIDHWRDCVLLSAMGVLASSCFLSQQFGFVLYTLVGIGACYASIAKTEGADIQLYTSSRDLKLILGITLGGIVVTFLAVRILAST